MKNLENNIRELIFVLFFYLISMVNNNKIKGEVTIKNVDSNVYHLYAYSFTIYIGFLWTIFIYNRRSEYIYIGFY